MSRASIRSAVIAVVAVVTMQVAAGPAQAGPVTYNYVGNNFNFCGFGCPDNLPSGVDVTPVGVGGEVVIDDFVIASLTFAAALEPNRAYTQDQLPAILAWSMGDASGVINVSGTTFGPFPDFLDDGQLNSVPPLQLSTDADGNIVTYQMGVHVLPHLIFITSPPMEIVDGDEHFFIADGLTAFYAPDIGTEDFEWDVFGSTPGRWTGPQPVPEPATVLLLVCGIVTIGSRGFRERKRTSPSN
jgi:hypothetical protein